MPYRAASPASRGRWVAGSSSGCHSEGCAINQLELFRLAGSPRNLLISAAE